MLRSSRQQRLKNYRHECGTQLWCASGRASSSTAATHAELAGSFDSIPSALAALAAGEVVVVLDDEARENEGDLVMAADKVLAAHTLTRSDCVTT